MTTIRRVWYVRRVNLRVTVAWALGLACGLPVIWFCPPAAFGFIWAGLGLVVASELAGMLACCFGRKTVADCPVCGHEIRIWLLNGGGYCNACHQPLTIRNGSVTPATGAGEITATQRVA